MPDNIAPQTPTMVQGEVRADSFSFLGKLDRGETLTGTPTLSVYPAGLSVSDPVVNDAPLVILNSRVTAGKAVVFQVEGGTPGVEYMVTVTVQTSNGQTLIGQCVIQVKGLALPAGP